MMKKLIVAAVLVAMSGVPGFSQAIPWDGVVSLDSVEVEPGSHFGIKLRMANNDLGIALLFVPLQFDNTVMALDSVSFDGSFKVDGVGGTYIQPSPNQVYISYVPDVYPVPIISATTGIIAELYFTLSSEAAMGPIYIDSIYEDIVLWNGTHITTQIGVSDESGSGLYLPSFMPGSITVSSPTAAEDDKNDLLPSEFMLDQNYPNPFNPTTAIQFALPTGSHVTLDVFNVLGRKVVRLADGYYSAGLHRIDFDASDQPTGIYFYRLTYEGGAETKKMVFLK